MAEEKNTKTFAETVFEAEDNSAATISKKKLDKYGGLAARIFNTGVLSPSEMVWPGFSDLATKLLATVEGSYRTLYYTKVLNIDLTYIALIEVLIGLYDALNDPIMGAVYDKTRTRWGKARPYILLGALPYYMASALVFFGGVFFGHAVPNDPRKIIYIFIMLFIKETFSTIYNIPRGHFLTMQTPNPDDRIAVGLLQTYIGGVGSAIVYSFIPFLIDFNERGMINFPMATLYATVAGLTAFVGVAGNIMMAVKCKERVMLQPKPAPLTKSIFYILKNKYMLRNTIAGLSTSWISSGGFTWDLVAHNQLFGSEKMPGSIANFFVELPQNILNPLSVTFIPGFRKFFKNNRSAVLTLRIWDFLTMLIMCVLTIPFIEHRLFICIVSSICLGLNAINNAPATVFEQEVGREITDYTEYMTGERPDGTIGILQQLIAQFIRPLNTLFGLAMIKWSGYDMSLPMLPWAQNNKIVYQRSFFLYRGIGLISTVINLIPYFFYDLVGEKREQMYLALNERRAMMAKEDNHAEEFSEIISQIED